MIILGIDPGAVSGAYAMLRPDGSGWPDDLPVVNGQVDAAALSLIVHENHVDTAVVELVSSMPKQGVASTFKFGVAYGIIRGVLAANGVPTVFVTPSKWKGHFRLDRDKEKSRALAIQRFPDMASRFSLKRHQNRAEALLIAQYYIETQRGMQ